MGGSISITVVLIWLFPFRLPLLEFVRGVNQNNKGGYKAMRSYVFPRSTLLPEVPKYFVKLRSEETLLMATSCLPLSGAAVGRQQKKRTMSPAMIAMSRALCFRRFQSLFPKAPRLNFFLDGPI